METALATASKVSGPLIRASAFLASSSVATRRWRRWRWSGTASWSFFWVNVVEIWSSLTFTSAVTAWKRLRVSSRRRNSASTSFSATP